MRFCLVLTRGKTFYFLLVNFNAEITDRVGKAEGYRLLLKSDRIFY